jgi:hypothetical protein
MRDVFIEWSPVTGLFLAYGAASWVALHPKLDNFHRATYAALIASSVAAAVFAELAEQAGSAPAGGAFLGAFSGVVWAAVWSRAASSGRQ